MKKLGILTLTLCLLSFFLYVPETKAKTLGELKAELEQTEKELAENEGQRAITEEEKRQVNQNIYNIQSDIAVTEQEIEDLKEEIEELNVEIKNKDKQIKDMMNFVQLSNGESMYLEYAFGAQSFTDFIYRFAVAEQLADYNAKMIDEYHNMINENEQKGRDLEDKTKELQQEQVNLSRELEKLNQKLIELEDSSISIEDDIKAQKELIEIYEERGCKEDEDIDTCGQKLLPTTTAFYRQLVSGYVTSEFGYRCLTIQGYYQCSGHSGIDVSTGEIGAPVYAVGTGMVSAFFYRNSCGGNMVFIQHKLTNGQTYTSAYYHLRDVYVSVGDIVTRDTVIGTMGGDPDIEWWDSCSTGDHSHLTMAYGSYPGDFYSWNDFVANIFDPREMINFPSSHYTYFNDRLTEYE